ncbi:MAG TPA: ABC transporter ATP-binding protein [Candidatus Saccharimonadales bacterium]|nr:ABC transporter ATP-binding protein [Candidatus Saccharimonadales bacterium]
MLKRKSLSNYRRVYSLLLRTYGKSWQVQLSFVMALVSRACKFVVLPIVASVLIASLAKGDYDRAKNMVLIFASASAVIGILSPLTRYVALLGENPVYEHMLSGYFNKLLVKDLKYFNESMTGYITTASRQYGDNSIMLIRKLRESYLTTAFTLIVPIIVISFVDILLGLLVLALSVVQAVYLLYASQKIAPYRVQSREMYKKVSGIISDAVTNIVAVKSAAQEQSIARTLGENMKKETNLFMVRYAVQAKMIAWRELITVMFFLALFWTTVHRISGGLIDVAGAVLVITYSFTILAAIYELSDALDEHDDFVDKIIPAFDLIQEKNVITDTKNPTPLGKVKGKIVFKDVEFSYSEGDTHIPVFKGLNLTIPAQQKVGIVGLSGAGKSTLAKLLLRFEQNQQGSITIDGVNIQHAAAQEVRRNIAYVPQEPLLFHDTIAANIRLANLEATDKQVQDAANAAHAGQFIDALPGKFKSIVGERGVKLSGGQKQRIAIARAVLQDSPIIVLDEATSALDSESEQIIKNSFATILKGKTAIVIAHRLSTLAEMDRIVLLHEGQVIEDGSHKELLAKKGLYAKLWNKQRLHPEELEANDGAEAV